MPTRTVFDTPYTAFVRKVEEAFFAAMAQGYAMEGKLRPLGIFPGWKRLVVVHKRFRITDEWSDDGGRTFIEIHDPPGESFPVWVMRYAGHYEDWAIPILKAALADRYQASEFCGGRGPKRYAPAYDQRVHGIVNEINASGGRKDISPSWDGCVYGSFDFYTNKCSGGFERFSGKEEIYTEHFPHLSKTRHERCGGSHDYWGGMLI